MRRFYAFTTMMLAIASFGVQGKYFPCSETITLVCVTSSGRFRLVARANKLLPSFRSEGFPSGWVWPIALKAKTRNGVADGGWICPQEPLVRV